jgi:hypothetical protein
MALLVTPVRADGVSGSTVRVYSDCSVKPAPPSFRDMWLEGLSQEFAVLKPVFTYVGGLPGTHYYRWLRCAPAISGGDDEATAVAAAAVSDDDLVQVGSAPTYTPTVADVGCRVLLECTPVRSDGAMGAPLLAESDLIAASDPVVRSLRLVRQGVTLSYEVRYVGGQEGASVATWLRRPFGEPTVRPFELGNAQSYTIQVADVGSQISVVYRPVRSDGVVGLDRESDLSERIRLTGA